jgi:PAS domain S-box-containing protein
LALAGFRHQLEMLLRSFRRGWTWLTPVYALACAAVVFAWIVADKPFERAVLIGPVVAFAAVAVAFGMRLANEVRRRNEHLLGLAGIVETTGDAVVAVRLDRTVTAWNSGAERLFGYTAEEMVGASVAHIVPPGDEGSLQESLDRMLEKGNMHTYEVKRRRKDGSLVDVQITLSPMRDDRGELVGISSIIRDISERKALEAEREVLLVREREARADAEYARRLLEEQNKHLLQLDRMKDDFVASVSHELRTPLTSISGYLDLVLEDADDVPTAQRNYLEVVRRNAERLQRLVGDLLFVAQVDAGRISLELGNVDLSSLVDDAVEAARPVAVDKRISLTVDVAPIEIPRGDALRLGQVMDNVLSNAVKFTPENGAVTVRALLEEGRAIVEVADTGIGISTQDQARLFDRFFRSEIASDLAIPGTGLGLAIVKAIVEGHDGSISITSEPGRGTTVRLELPAQSAASIEPRYVETLH